jgi:hypothetical protein
VKVKAKDKDKQTSARTSERAKMVQHALRTMAERLHTNQTESKINKMANQSETQLTIELSVIERRTNGEAIDATTSQSQQV